MDARGHSRDGKRDDPQIVFGLVCTAQGCPIAVEVFKGNTADPATVAAQVATLKPRFGIEHLAWVGDRGMLTSARIEQVLKPQGMDWVSSLRAPQIAQLAHAGLLRGVAHALAPQTYAVRRRAARCGRLSIPIQRER